MAAARPSPTPGPRPTENCLQDDQYFMSVAHLIAQKSRDPRTQVGACIVKDGEIISVGYNHMPMGDDKHDWDKKGPDNKYFYVCYAVTHAILSAWGSDLNGASVYTTLFPSDKCCINIILSGIKKIYYRDDRYAEKNWCKAAKKMLYNMKIPYEMKEPVNVTMPPPVNVSLLMPLHTTDDPYYPDS